MPRSKDIVRITAAALLAVLALSACQRGGPEATGNNQAGAGAAPAPDVAAPATPSTAKVPSLQLTTLDGAAYDLAAHRGKWVVVNYWATWCAPCLEEMPELSALASLRSHVEVLGLAYEDIEPGVMREFLDRHPVTYPVAIIDTLDPPADFPAPPGLPMTWLIAPDGTRAGEFLGPVTAASLEQAIAAAGGPAPGEAVAPPADGDGA
ncbi:TlpA family protein disulfide reductase [Lysobacter sp. GX 14042]|uniref:TlpA family protein disulfide reductase n=1 Tax=Lysobacter sp. GX 14042 TaxID=2907155 RepID=UPI001F45E6E4|nr:TlpA disulfide reductase family protein [Lysobacter sp. GX 14042]MCE7031051.1 TlpA family protein disulfide reductase [Lysobacter sp. GX 14042]